MTRCVTSNAKLSCIARAVKNFEALFSNSFPPIVLNIEGYVYLVPYIKERGARFLKTIIPSRKATKEYLG